MTVADIKEYINEQKSIALLVKDDEVLSTESVVATLDNIRSMLDELEPKAKWVKQDYSTGYSEYGTASICSNCGSEVISKTNYCSNCGARMNDEVDDGSAN